MDTPEFDAWLATDTSLPFIEWCEASPAERIRSRRSSFTPLGPIFSGTTTPEPPWSSQSGTAYTGTWANAPVWEIPERPTLAQDFLDRYRGLDDVTVEVERRSDYAAQRIVVRSRDGRHSATALVLDETLARRPSALREATDSTIRSLRLRRDRDARNRR